MRWTITITTPPHRNNTSSIKTFIENIDYHGDHNDDHPLPQEYIMFTTFHWRLQTRASHANTVRLINCPQFFKIEKSPILYDRRNHQLRFHFLGQTTSMKNSQVVIKSKVWTSRYILFLDLIRYHQLHRYSSSNDRFEISRVIEKSDNWKFFYVWKDLSR